MYSWWNELHTCSVGHGPDMVHVHPPPQLYQTRFLSTMVLLSWNQLVTVKILVCTIHLAQMLDRTTKMLNFRRNLAVILWLPMVLYYKIAFHVGIISIMQYHDTDRGFVELAISRCPDVRRYRARMHAGQHAVHSTMQNGNNYLEDGNFMLYNRASPHHRTHVLTAAIVGGPYSPTLSLQH